MLLSCLGQKPLLPKRVPSSLLFLNSLVIPRELPALGWSVAVLFMGSKTSAHTSVEATGQWRGLQGTALLTWPGHSKASCLRSIFKGKELEINLPGGG